ncbi:MAG: PAS domain S-box protein [Deltaproteobacteria bacterium]|nr:PAS domain S-box protein [Deltaproteobacteria bacterium]
MTLEKQRLADIISFLPDATFVIDRDGKVIAWNKAIESLTGMKSEEVLGKSNREYAVPFYGKQIPILIDLALSRNEVLGDRYTSVERNDGTIVAEVYTPHLRPGGAFLWAKASPLYDAKGQVVGAIETVRDITKRRKIEQALLEQVHLFQVLIDAIPTPIFYKDVQGSYLGCNKAFENCLGLAKDQIVGHNIYDILPLEKAKPYDQADQQLMLHPGVQTFESATVDATGIEREVIFSKATFLGTDGNLNGLVGTILDITRLKKTQKALRDSEAKLRFLSSRLLKSHEGERRRLSLELHDELGQTLNVLKMQIRYVARKLHRDQGDLKADCDYMLDYINEIIETVRRMSRDLSPSILEDLGLTVALKHLTDEFTKHYQIACRVRIPQIDQLFPQESQILIFRIIQESLTNIAKYAEASQVTLDIQTKGDNISFLISDNGRGFDAEQVIALNSVQKGLGLAAMDERVRMLGGSLEIWSKEGAGTRLSFSLPINK